jgi:hypothetical protein
MPTVTSSALPSSPRRVCRISTYVDFLSVKLTRLGLFYRWSACSQSRTSSSSQCRGASSEWCVPRWRLEPDSSCLTLLWWRRWQGTKIDPTLTRSDRLVGQVLGLRGQLPQVFTEVEISYYLLRRLLGKLACARLENSKLGVW